MKEAGSTCTVGLLRIDFGRSDVGMQVDARMDFTNKMMLGRVIFTSQQQSIETFGSVDCHRSLQGKSNER